jgi:GT2 family glycosyltransferase
MSPRVVQVNNPTIVTDIPFYAGRIHSWAFYFNGSGFIIKRDLFEKIIEVFGSFYDPQLFIGHTEFDASAKICKSGERIYFLDEILNYHRAVERQSKDTSIDRKFFEFRNRLYVTRKYVPILHQAYVVPLLLGSMFLASVKNRAVFSFLKSIPSGLMMQVKEPVLSLTKKELSLMTGRQSYLFLFVLLMWKKRGSFHG